MSGFIGGDSERTPQNVKFLDFVEETIKTKYELIEECDSIINNIFKFLISEKIEFFGVPIINFEKQEICFKHKTLDIEVKIGFMGCLYVNGNTISNIDIYTKFVNFFVEYVTEYLSKDFSFKYEDLDILKDTPTLYKITYKPLLFDLLFDGDTIDCFGYDLDLPKIKLFLNNAIEKYNLDIEIQQKKEHINKLKGISDIITKGGSNVR